MAQHELRELVKAANPVPAPSRLLPQDEGLDTLFEEVMTRSRNMGGEQRALRVAETPEPPPMRRRSPLLVAAVAFAVVVIVGAAILLLSRGGSPDVVNTAPLTPLEVGEALNEATVTGDWETLRLLYADDATITDVMGNPLAAFLEPSRNQRMADWDGDGEITEFDGELSFEATDYAAGVTLAHTCTQIDFTTVVCEEVVEGHAFLTDEARSTFQATYTFTVVDGRIVHLRFDGSPNNRFDSEDSKTLDLRFEYGDWVLAKLGVVGYQDLFDSGLLYVTPDTVERHRELIAEWVAQR